MVNNALLCLLKKAQLGYVTKQRVQEVQDLVTRLQDDVIAGGGAVDDLAIAQKAQGILDRRVAQRQRATALTINKKLEATDLFHSRMRSGMSPLEAAREFIYTEPSAVMKHGGHGTSFDQRFNSYRLLYGSMAAKGLDPIIPKMFGTKAETALSKAVGRDLWALSTGVGERSSDPTVRQSAEALAKLFEQGGKDFGDMGGDIAVRKDFAFGLFSDANKMRNIHRDQNVAQQKWVDDVMNLGLDLDHLRDELPGMGMSEGQVRTLLNKVYDANISGNLVNIGEFLPKGLQNVSNARRHARLLKFKSYDAWEQYQDKYGQGNLFKITMNYVDSISRDMSALEVFGPSPEAFKNHVLKEMANADPAAALKNQNIIERGFKYSLGQYNAGVYKPINEATDTLRNLMVSGYLGSTALQSVLMDTLGLGALSRHIVRLPMLKPTLNALATVFSPQKGRRQEAAEFGYLLDKFIQAHHQDMRSVLDAGGQGLASAATSRMAQFTVTTSGLNRATFAQRIAHTEELGIQLAKIARKGNFSGLDERTIKWFSGFGLGEDDLAVIAQHGLDEGNYFGTTIEKVNPNKMFEMVDNEAARNTAKKITGLMANMTEMVSPSFNPRAKALFAEMKQGPIGAIAGGTTSTFTGYITSLYRNTILPGLAAEKSGVGKAKFLAQMTLPLWALGMLYTQVRNLSQGQDAAPLDSKLALDGVMAGGLLGPLGSALISQGRYNTGGLLQSFVPPAALLDKAVKVGTSAVKSAMGDEKAKPSRDAITLLQNLTPGQNSWWYGLVLKRALFDQLKLATDPDYGKTFKRQIREQEKRGSGYWWEPGETSPERSPNLETALQSPLLGETE